MEITDHTITVFQCDADIVKQIRKQDNYLIRYSDDCPGKEYCAIYFSSNDIYFPNTETVFQKRIVEKDFYEWYGTRIQKAHKHIFVRDIFKQWYLAGINEKINTPELLNDFLRQETEGYKIIAVGSSAGAYAAILHGSLLGAERVIAFNPQFEINSLLERSQEAINPLVFRLKETNTRKYYDIVPFVNDSVDIFYFYSNQSSWDMEQCRHSEKLKEIRRISFSTAHHGIPFLKVALHKVLNLEKNDLEHYAKKVQSPFIFTVKTVCINKAVSGFLKQLYEAYKKRH